MAEPVTPTRNPKKLRRGGTKKKERDRERERERDSECGRCVVS
jgi:hypothetical protein